MPIRPATPADGERIKELAAAFNHFGDYVPVFANMVNQNHAALTPYGVNGEIEIFVEELGQIRGFIAVEWLPAVGHIHGVVVDEMFRRQNLANVLLDHVENLARDRRIPALECITAETENIPALNCFLHFGFENRGRVGRYPKGQNAVRLHRMLKPQT